MDALGCLDGSGRCFASVLSASTLGTLCSRFLAIREVTWSGQRSSDYAAVPLDDGLIAWGSAISGLGSTFDHRLRPVSESAFRLESLSCLPDRPTRAVSAPDGLSPRTHPCFKGHLRPREGPFRAHGRVADVVVVTVAKFAKDGLLTRHRKGFLCLAPIRWLRTHPGSLPCTRSRSWRPISAALCRPLLHAIRGTAWAATGARRTQLSPCRFLGSCEVFKSQGSSPGRLIEQASCHLFFLCISIHKQLLLFNFSRPSPIHLGLRLEKQVKTFSERGNKIHRRVRNHRQGARSQSLPGMIHQRLPARAQMSRRR